MDGVEETVNFDHIRNHYYQSHERVNPNALVPAGPVPLLPWTGAPQ